MSKKTHSKIATRSVISHNKASFGADRSRLICISRTHIASMSKDGSQVLNARL